MAHHSECRSRDEVVARLQKVNLQTEEPTGPFGAKSVSELPMDGIAPAMADAIHDATGVWIREVPSTPERVWRALWATE